MIGLAGMILVLAAHFLFWRLGNPESAAPQIHGPTAGIAYNGYGRWNGPQAAATPSAEEVSNDIALLASVTKRIRTYSSTEMPSLLEHARSHGLSVSLGAWLDQTPGVTTRSSLLLSLLRRPTAM